MADTSTVNPGFGLIFSCNISGVDSDDSAIATYRPGSNCFAVASAESFVNHVSIFLFNRCNVAAQIGADARIAVMVYDK